MKILHRMPGFMYNRPRHRPIFLLALQFLSNNRISVSRTIGRSGQRAAIAIPSRHAAASASSGSLQWRRRSQANHSHRSFAGFMMESSIYINLQSTKGRRYPSLAHSRLRHSSWHRPTIQHTLFPFAISLHILLSEEHKRIHIPCEKSNGSFDRKLLTSPQYTIPHRPCTP